MEATMLAPLKAKATGHQTDEFCQSLAKWVATINHHWADSWQDRHSGESPAPVKDLLNMWKACGHAVKWACATGIIDPSIPLASIRPNHRDRWAAAVYLRSEDDRKALIAEMNRYAREQANQTREAIYRAHPELAPDHWADPPWEEGRE